MKIQVRNPISESIKETNELICSDETFASLEPQIGTHNISTKEVSAQPEIVLSMPDEIYSDNDLKKYCEEVNKKLFALLKNYYNL